MIWAGVMLGVVVIAELLVQVGEKIRIEVGVEGGLGIMLPLNLPPTLCLHLRQS